MFKPVRLFRITIQVPDRYMSDVLGILGDFRLLHLINISETRLGQLGYVAATRAELVARFEQLLKNASSLLKSLEVKGEIPAVEHAPRPEKDIFFLEQEINQIQSSTLPVLSKIEHTKRQLSQKKDLIKKMQLVSPADIDFTRLSSLYFTVYRFGTLPIENLDRLEESLSDIHHAIVKIQESRKQLVVAAFCLKEDSEVLDRALKSAFFNGLDLPQDLKGHVGQIIKDLKDELGPLETELEQLEREKEELAKKYGTRLLLVREKAYLGRILLKASAKFGKIDHTYLLTGWVPVDSYERLKERILKATKGLAVVDAVDPEEVREVRSGIIKIPILFNNPLLIRPFERLTTLYGTPSYQEIEPTVFLAISFVLLFGMMFGDVGHGLVLFLAGFYVFRRLYKYIDYGIILMECGVSSMLFGFLYGSIFGLEDLFPALWLHPMKDIGRFMFASAIIGVGMISLGFVLNLLNIIKRKEYNKILSASGLTGALLYWLLAGLAIRYYTIGPPGPLEKAVSEGVAALLLFIMFIERPIRLFLRQKRTHLSDASSKQKKPSLSVVILESLIETLDSVLRFLANTVSFVRVAAFALTHAALFLGVFSIADMVSHGSRSGIAYFLTLIIGNIVIIVLEAMVVSIQTIRLEYYEFFSKFFRGGGVPFKPIVETEKDLVSDKGA